MYLAKKAFLTPKIARNIFVRNSNFGQGNVISGPPTQRVSFVEKMTHAAVFFVGIMIIPSLVLLNMETLKGEQPKEE